MNTRRGLWRWEREIGFQRVDRVIFFFWLVFFSIQQENKQSTKIKTPDTDTDSHDKSKPKPKNSTNRNPNKDLRREVPRRFNLVVVVNVALTNHRRSYIFTVDLLLCLLRLRFRGREALPWVHLCQNTVRFKIERVRERQSRERDRVESDIETISPRGWWRVIGFLPASWSLLEDGGDELVSGEVAKR